MLFKNKKRKKKNHSTSPLSIQMGIEWELKKLKRDFGRRFYIQIEGPTFFVLIVECFVHLEKS